jgi:hypothetical protein
MIPLPMTYVTVSMHEEMHERTKEEWYIKECTKDVGAVLREQQHTGNDEKANQNQSRRRGQKAALIAMAAVIVQ